ncbi:TcpE family conjugal transfer membrane protein [Niallia endozanthoxylica]|uniref:TcpE family protein n=1 Tax=Niallia endozanthoxylica TaxID=2036016 RepID=A0A5J5H2W0_9BACI|nr:TcpE family conjugal transfer membrane protein [Niallia endozanthoxylica]KAA9014915.1 hypothetical protein F4V44_23245 [Niallia endozanthoxylica]
MEKNQRVLLLVLNDFLKFDRKIYQLFGLKLGRPLKLKTLLYFLFILILEVVLYFTPVLGFPLHLLPESFLLIIPAFLAYLLSDIPAEGRMPLAFLRSFLLYQYRKMKKVTYCRGREIQKPTKYVFSGYATVSVDKQKKFKGIRVKMNPQISISYTFGRDWKRKEHADESST